MPNAKGGYWFAGKFTTNASGQGSVDILCNKDLTRYIISFFSASNVSGPVGYIKTYSYSESTQTFTISVILSDAASELVSAVTDYLIYVSLTELITADHYTNGDLAIVSESLLNPKV
jgi:hypothetical protein